MKAYGCDAKTAGANGYRLLKKAEIRKEIRGQQDTTFVCALLPLVFMSGAFFRCVHFLIR